jgi:hypothetical protein
VRRTRSIIVGALGLIACISHVCAGALYAETVNGEAVIQLSEQGELSDSKCLRIERADCSAVTSLEAVAALIERYRLSGTTSSGKRLKVLRVVISSGIHRFTRPFDVINWGMSSPHPTLVIQGAGQDATYILGSIAAPETEWHRVGADEMSTREAAANVQFIDYEKVTGHRGTSNSQAELFGAKESPPSIAVAINNLSIPLARWPNERYTTIKDVVGSPQEGFKIHFSDTGMRTLPKTGALISGYLFNDWAYERVPVTPDPTDAKAALISPGGSTFGVRVGQRVFIENSLAELDSPNEWFFDEKSQKLYFWSGLGDRTGANNLEISVNDKLFRIENSKDVLIRDLSLENNLGDALEIHNSSNVSIDHIAIRDVGNTAVTIVGGENDVISDCLIEDVGASGISVYGGDRMSLWPGRHRVQNCKISRVGRRLKSYKPAILLQGVGNEAIRNLILDTPHAAIIFSGNDHLIEANHIADVVKETDDAGAIYTGRDWAARGTVIRNNFVQNVKGKGGDAGQAVGLYLDDQASGITATGNIFANVTTGILVGGGRDNRVNDNVFFANKTSIVLDARGVTWQRAQTQDVSWNLWQNLRRLPYQGPIYRQRYPHLAELPIDSPGVPKYNEIRWNAFVASGGVKAIDPGYFSWSDAENAHFGRDIFLAPEGAPLTSPSAYEINKSKLPPNWGADYPLRQLIPN